MKKKSHLAILLIAIFLVLMVVLPVSADNYSIFIPYVVQTYVPVISMDEIVIVDLDPTPSTSTPISMVIDQQSNIHVLWDTLYSPRFIYHTISANGTTTSPQPVALSLGMSTILYSPYMGSNGVIHFLWKNYLGSGQENPYRLLYSNYDDGTWSTEEIVTTYGYYGLKGMVHPSDLDEIKVTFLTSDFLFSEIFQTKRNGSAWSEPTKIEPSFYGRLVWPDIEGGVHIWGTEYPDLINYIHWKNGDFIGPQVQFTGQFSNHKTQLDSLNNLNTYWTGSVPIPGGTVTGLYYQCLSNNQVWNTVEIPSGMDAVSGYVYQAYAGGDHFALTWKDADTQELWFALWSDCQKIYQRLLDIPLQNNWSIRSATINDPLTKFCILIYDLSDSNHYKIFCKNLTPY